VLIISNSTIMTSKLISGAVSLVALCGFAGAALAAPTVSDNANGNACFGQARASYAQGGPNGMLAPNTNGYYISQRKGDNPADNAAYIAANCAL
jgi:hypothetical protein